MTSKFLSKYAPWWAPSSFKIFSTNVEVASSIWKLIFWISKTNFQPSRRVPYRQQGIVTSHVGFDPSWTEGSHQNVVFRQIDGAGFGERVERRFAHTISILKIGKYGGFIQKNWFLIEGFEKLAPRHFETGHFKTATFRNHDISKPDVSQPHIETIKINWKLKFSIFY